MINPELTAPLTTEVAPQTALETPPVLQGQMPAPTSEQIQTSDQVFSRPDEYRTVAGLIGLWTSVLVLHDLAVEAFETPAEEELAAEASPPEDPTPKEPPP